MPVPASNMINDVGLEHTSRLFTINIFIDFNATVTPFRIYSSIL